MKTYPPNHIQPHARVTTEIVRAMLKLPRPRQSELFRESEAFLHRQCGEHIGSMHDFITAEPDAVLTYEMKDKLLARIAQAMRDDDLAVLQTVEHSQP